MTPLQVQFLPPLDYGAGPHGESWTVQYAASLANPSLLPSLPQTGFQQANATVLQSPLLTSVTLISHKLELSTDPTFATVDCTQVGLTPIAGNTIRRIIGAAIEMACENLPVGKFYYIRVSSSNVLGYGPAMVRRRAPLADR